MCQTLPITHCCFVTENELSSENIHSIFVLTPFSFIHHHHEYNFFKSSFCISKSKQYYVCDYLEETHCRVFTLYQSPIFKHRTLENSPISSCDTSDTECSIPVNSAAALKRPPSSNTSPCRGHVLRKAKVRRLTYSFLSLSFFFLALKKNTHGERRETERGKYWLFFCM